MPQVTEYYAVPRKPWGWHLTLVKEWLRGVQGGLSDRKYVKWLRGRKVFERSFIAQTEVWLGIVHAKGRRPTLNEVGEELLQELDASEAKQAAQLEKATQMPKPVGPISAPSADDDAFLRALLERFTELNPYLSAFVFKQVGEDFLGPNEIYRRIQTNDYAGIRPTMPHFGQWIEWLEWLGGLEKVGFRHRTTKAGGEIGDYLKEIPIEELLEATEEPVEAPAAEDDGPATAEEAIEDPGQDEEDEDDEDLDGLDLPPEAEVDREVVPYWQKESSEATGARDSTLAKLTREVRELRDVPDPRPEPTPVETAPQSPKPTRSPERPPRVAAVTAPAPVPDERVLSREALRLAVGWWLDGTDRGRGATSSVPLGPHPSGKPLGLFKLLVLATLSEADGEPRVARSLFSTLDQAGALDSFLLEEAPLEEVLEVAWAARVSPQLEERLVHLLRYRRGLRDLEPTALKGAGDARAMGVLLRDQVSGPTLGAGLLFVLRELIAAGVGPEQGLEAVAWLPSPLD